MPRVLSGRVALVTGGGRGLGRSIVLGLVAAGARVVVTAAREAEEIEAVVREAGEDWSATAVVADVTRAADCQKTVEAAIDRFGRIDILVNNAARGTACGNATATARSCRFWEVDPRLRRLVMDTNVNGPLLMAQAALPYLTRAGWGRIVNISMDWATMRQAGSSPYGPSKAALEFETAIWAKDLEGTGVTVNAVSPGAPLRNGTPTAPRLGRRQANLLETDIVMPPLLWLLSGAADFVTGKRLLATRWRTDVDPAIAAAGATEDAGRGIDQAAA